MKKEKELADSKIINRLQIHIIIVDTENNVIDEWIDNRDQEIVKQNSLKEAKINNLKAQKIEVNGDKNKMLLK